MHDDVVSVADEEVARAANGSIVGDIEPKQRRRRLTSKFLIIVRRSHLYAGLFLIPWVILYGVTGPMFTHEGLFSEATEIPLNKAAVDASALANFPSADALAQEICEQLERDTGRNIELFKTPSAEFTNPIMFEGSDGSDRYVIHLDPVSKSAVLSKSVIPDKPDQILSPGNVRLANAPISLAQATATDLFHQAQVPVTSEPRQLGWSKLNFLATVDNKPAKITYVLNDGHVDVMEYSVSPSMTTRQLFMRLHTTHGQTPHYNARFFWTVISDAMGLAMVTWAITGLLMWWQIKRTRLVGVIVILLSISTAIALFVSVKYFYATTTL